MKAYAVYILAVRKTGPLYVGVTSDLRTRLWQHRTGYFQGFTARYNIHRLVYVEWHEEIDLAIRREKRLKDWRRAWKVELIEAHNPGWVDLASSVLGDQDAG